MKGLQKGLAFLNYSEPWEEISILTSHATEIQEKESFSTYGEKKKDELLINTI